MVSVIIITYNRLKDLIELLDNLKQQTFRDFEIIVVDNNSQDETLQIIPDRFPHVRFVANDFNAGVPGGRNIGIRHAQNDYLVFIDNDAEMDENGLQRIVEIFNNNPEAGILTFKILNYFTKEIDWGSWVINPQLQDVKEIVPVQSFVGAGWAMRKSVVDKIGLMWDDLFFMHEEKEYSLRALNAGFQILFTPQIKVYHKISPQNRYQVDERFFYYGIRNEIWIYLKNVPWKFTIPHLLFVGFAGGLYALRKGFFKQYLKGVGEGIAHSGKALKLRKPIKDETYKEYLRLLNKRKDPLWKRLVRFVKGGE